MAGPRKMRLSHALANDGFEDGSLYSDSAVFDFREERVKREIVIPHFVVEHTRIWGEEIAAEVRARKPATSIASALLESDEKDQPSLLRAYLEGFERGLRERLRAVEAEMRKYGEI